MMAEPALDGEPKYPPYRPLVPVVVAFAGGILAREYLALPEVLVWGIVLVAILGFPLLRWLGVERGAWLALGLLVAGAGWVRLDVAVGRRPANHIAHFLSREPTLVRVRGTVASEPELRVLPPMPLSGDSKWLASEERQRRFDLDCDAAHVNGEWRVVCGRLRVVEHAPRGEVTYRYGDRVAVVGSARLPSPPGNPGQVDGATLLRRRGIDATMSVSAGGLAVERAAGSGFLSTLHSARERLRGTLQTTLSSDRRAAALQCALVLGDRTDVGDDLEEAFARTGTIHLLAVSGFNVGVVAWVMWVIAAAIGLGRQASGLLVLCAVVAYALVTGAPPSVVRAAVMSGAFVLSILGRRQMDLVQSAALAAIVLLVARPFDLFNVGFQLSFVAVLGIILLIEDVGAPLRPRKSLFELAAGEEGVGRWRRLLRAAHWTGARAGGVTLAAWLAVFPLTAFYFNTFSPITLVANLIAAPLAAALTALGFIHIGLAAVHPAASLLTSYPARGASALLSVVVRAADMTPFAWEHCSAPQLGWLLGYYALALVFVARRRLGLSAARAASLWLLGGIAYLAIGPSATPPRGLEMTALDVQDGNATVLRFPDGATVLYDCGSYGRNDVGRWVAAPALWHWGVRTIDLLVVTHADADHVNGIPALLDRFKVGKVIHRPVLERSEAGQQLLAMLDRRRIPHRSAKAGDRIEVGRGNVLDALWPMDWSLRLRPDDQNENSLVLRVEHAGRRILLGADIQQLGATVLLHSGLDLRADVLLVPHHGRAMAATPEFARAVRPAYAICSTRSGHLPPATVAAYEAAGARVLTTCRDGAITARISKGALEVSGFRARGGPRPVTRDP
ncbi:MAG: ComEC/Rec2 family competence protein [Planctomycetes bacterium]|nr:ComEC/Rec2 family competence protein [Planctomycetota bacterium]